MNDQVKAEKGAASAAPAPAASKLVHYVFANNEGITQRNKAGVVVYRKAIDRILTLDMTNEDDVIVAEYLAKDGVLQKHQGKRVKSLSIAGDKMTLGERINEMLGLSDSQLLALLPKASRSKYETRGDIIAALIQKEVR